MEVTILCTGEVGTDGAASLRQWMLTERELAGRVRLVHAPPEPGTLGTVATMLEVLGPGGVATAVASALIAWLRRRVGDVKVKATRSDGASITLTSTNVRNLDPDGVARVLGEVEVWLDVAAPAPAPGDQGEAAE
ncbi:effector-associated constant component EACC1 [Kitasatospora sp. NPDC094028]